MTRRRKNWVQLSFPKPRTWGGARKGAGRKKRTPYQLHRARPAHLARFPMHVTLKLLYGVPAIRTGAHFRQIKRAFRYGCDRFGMRLCEFSVQDGHIHLIVEAEDKNALSRGMQGLEIRLARAVNRVLGRH